MTPWLSITIPTVVTLLASVAWLKLNDLLVARGVMSGRLSRKLIHAGTGPIFVLCWLMFPDYPASRYAAAIIPLIITLKFALVGLGIVHDQAEIDSLTRDGDRREILKGPLFYGIAFVLITIFYWMDNVIGIIALMMLCGGDGLADIVGRRVKSSVLPWSKGKSLAGSLAMFLGGFVFSIAIVQIFLMAGKLPGTLNAYLPGILIIGFVCTIVESLPTRDIDNITVTMSALLLGHIIF